MKLEGSQRALIIDYCKEIQFLDLIHLITVFHILTKVKNDTLAVTYFNYTLIDVIYTFK